MLFFDDLDYKCIYLASLQFALEKYHRNYANRIIMLY